MKVSFCIIAFNEENTLDALFQDLLKQTYKKSEIEVILVDGMSTDDTLKKMKAFRDSHSKDYWKIKVLENKKRILAAGWNVALQAFDGDVILKVDAHASIPQEFIERNVEVLKSGEYVAGGPRPNITDEETPWKDTLLLAESSMFGSSIAPYRNEGQKEKTYVNSLFHGAYRREVFEKTGGFNEYLGRTEDNEIHYRIRKAGFKLCYSPDIQSFQHTRSSLKKMMKQKYGNGYWIGLTAGVCPKCLSLYHFVPFAFICGIITTTIMAVKKHSFLAKLMWGSYGTLSVVMSVLSVKNIKKHISQLALPFLFLALHVSYGIGTLVGLIKMPVWRRNHKICPAVEEVRQTLTEKQKDKSFGGR